MAQTLMPAIENLVRRVVEYPDFAQLLVPGGAYHRLRSRRPQSRALAEAIVRKAFHNVSLPLAGDEVKPCQLQAHGVQLGLWHRVRMLGDEVQRRLEMTDSLLVGAHGDRPVRRGYQVR